MLVLTPLVLFIATGEEVFKSPLIAISFMILVGFLMISRIPTLSLKKIKLREEIMAPVMLLFVVVLGLAYFHFWYVLSVIAILYLFTIPYTCMKFLKMKKEFEG